MTTVPVALRRMISTRTLAAVAKRGKDAGQDLPSWLTNDLGERATIHAPTDLRDLATVLGVDTAGGPASVAAAVQSCCGLHAPQPDSSWSADRVGRNRQAAGKRARELSAGVRAKSMRKTAAATPIATVGGTCAFEDLWGFLDVDLTRETDENASGIATSRMQQLLKDKDKPDRKLPKGAGGSKSLKAHVAARRRVNNGETFDRKSDRFFARGPPAP